MEKKRDKYALHVNEASALLATGTEKHKMSNKQLKILLRPLKRKEYGATPTVKKIIQEKYEQWKHRALLTFDDDSFDDSPNAIAGNNDDAGSLELTADEDAVASAMVFLHGRRTIV